MADDLLTRVLAATRLIHAAGLDERAWPEALAALARVLGGHTASLLVWTPAGIENLLVAHNIDPTLLQDYRQHYAALDPFNATQHGRPPGSINLTQDLIDDQTFTRTEFYADFWRRVGIHYAIGVELERSERSLVMTAIHRAAGRPSFAPSEVELFRQLGEQLRLALRQRQLLGSQAAVAAVVDGLRLAVILTDDAGRVAWANAGGEALLRAGDGLRLVLGCLACVRHDDTRELTRLIAAAGQTAWPAREAALRIGRPHGAPHLEVLVAPLLPGAGARLGVGPAARVLVAARRPQHRSVAPRLLQQLYGMTASEAQLAAALLAGQTLEAYAAQAGLSVETARSYLKGVFEATGTHRQSELVLLLAQGPLKLLG